ncbi:MAG: hypothetical protein KKA10_05100 [Euryarchaeota archaeon]|nr:hypothetical protein [Euryarchaeota archaeon]MCG2738273.1 hypothetical protein [Candidatus Methanoperedenaceae archaeon]
MAKRTCGKCGLEKEVKGAKICLKEHFICQSCASGKSTCPLCGKTMK